MRCRRLVLAVMLLTACAEERKGAASALTRDQLLDPAQCKSCHPQHYREWASSMHAYASDDPVFVAMNARGQRETKGQLGDFCVRCHAPMAVREGATSDGLDLAQLPSQLKGVTCYFCHNASHTEQAFNNGVVLANDRVMRGALSAPRVTPAHDTSYSPLHDRNRGESSALCGSCHDVVNGHGVHIERTFAEYQESLFGKAGPGFETCGGCHMPGRPGRAAQGSSGPTRTVHEHLWPGVDLALTAFPDREAQRLAVECALSSSARVYSVANDGLGTLVVKLETAAGHSQPSGSAQHRRLWLEVIAYDADDGVLFESGAIADDEDEDAHAEADRSLTMYRDWMYDAEGREVHMFWEAARSSDYPDGFSSLGLPAARTLASAHTLESRFAIPDMARIERITLRLRMRPIGRDVLRDLVDSGDLDPAVVEAMPTFTLHGASVEYRPLDGSVTQLWPDTLRCPDVYRCLLDGDPDCKEM